MADSYLASNEFPGDGSTTLWNVSFKGNRPDAGSGVVPYLNPADVKAQVITPATATEAEIAIDVPAVYVGPNQFQVTPAAPVGKIVRIYRATQDEYALVDYQSLQTVGEADLDLSNRQLVFITQESNDLAVRAREDAANSSTVAYSAVTTANAATVTANAANSKATTAIATANSALGVASNADAKSNTALANAASAEAHATAGDIAAAAAQTAANAAQTQATAANTAASNAVTVANGVDGKASTALANSATAISTANAATSTANGIDAKATTALTNANSALTTANAAATTANGIDAKATTALANANTANTTAGTAVTTANSAVSTANSAVTTANGAVTTANTAQTTASSKAANGANSDITSLSGLTTALSEAQGGTGVTSLAALKAALGLDDPWACFPIGSYVPVAAELTGVSLPSTSSAFYRYIKLSAADAHNTGVLTNESVTGVAPLVQATAVISLTGSPMNGQTVRLINTERRVLRAGSSGTVENDQMQGHNHGLLAGNTALIGTGSTGVGGQGISAGSSNQAYSGVGSPVTDGTNGTPRTGNETRAKSIGASYYLRIK